VNVPTKAASQVNESADEAVGKAAKAAKRSRGTRQASALTTRRCVRRRISPTVVITGSFLAHVMSATLTSVPVTLAGREVRMEYFEDSHRDEIVVDLR
jgi:hypothetical protein